MATHLKVAVGGALAGLLLVVAVVVRTTGASLAQPAPTPTATPGIMSGSPITHEQMHRMMDVMFGDGAGARMHEAMGADAEQLMDQCGAMMSMMQGMMGGMDAGAMDGMMRRTPGR